MSKLGLTRPKANVPLCTNLDLVAEHERLERDLKEAQRQALSDPRENSPVPGLVAQIQGLEQKMRDHTIEFELQALSKKRFAEIEAAHPPREGNDQDKALGLNLSTGPDAIIAEMGPEGSSIVSVTGADGEPIDFTGADWQSEADGMSNGQWQNFAMAVLRLNRGTDAAPFSVAASRQTRLSAQSSKSPSA